MGKERLVTHGHTLLSRWRRPGAGGAPSRGKLADGVDPSAKRKLDQISAEIQARTTFKLLVEEYLANMQERGRAPIAMKKKRWILLGLAAPLGKRPISEITSAEVLYHMKAIEKSGRRETAKKMRCEISVVFRLAVVTLRAVSDPTYASKDALMPPTVKSRAAITDEKKFGALLSDFEAFNGWRIIEALKFQILTMTCPGEVRGA